MAYFTVGGPLKTNIELLHIIINQCHFIIAHQTTLYTLSIIQNDSKKKTNSFITSVSILLLGVDMLKKYKKKKKKKGKRKKKKDQRVLKKQFLIGAFLCVYILNQPKDGLHIYKIPLSPTLCHSLTRSLKGHMIFFLYIKLLMHISFSFYFNDCAN